LAQPKDKFDGPHADLRKLLDYSYHSTYPPLREKMQDELIDHFCEGADPRGDQMLPWAVFTAGAMGAGKGYVTEWMNQQGYMSMKYFVTVDPDEMRKALPEWDAYVKHNAEAAGDLTQKEAGGVAELLGYKALRQRCNIIFDGSLRDHKWYTEYFEMLRRQYPGIRIMILHVEADLDEVLTRAEARGKETGRMVPREMLLASHEQVPKSVQALAPHADVVCKVLNHSGKHPEIVREPGAPYPKPEINVDWHFLTNVWKAIDADGDGVLSKSELVLARKRGSITTRIIESIDEDNDGVITQDEFAFARRRSQGFT
jgi:hypothetical protein